MTLDEARGRLLMLWGREKKTDPQMGEALDLTIKALMFVNESKLQKFLKENQFGR